MAKRTPKKKSPKKVETFRHDEASRKNIPTAEYQSVMRKEELSPLRIARGNRGLPLDFTGDGPGKVAGFTVAIVEKEQKWSLN